MNINRNHDSSRKEKPMNAITKTASVAMLVTLSLTLTSLAAESAPAGGDGGMVDDWLFQAEGQPLGKRTVQEIGWARKMTERIKRLPGAPDLSAELARLDELQKQLSSVGDKSDPAAARAVYLAVRAVKRAIMFRHPAIDFTRLLFIDQAFPSRGEWQHQTGHRLGWMANEGKLVVLDGLDPDGTVRELPPNNGPAAFWRPDLSFDARKVLFCMKPARDTSFHLYEINLDGTGLRQLTDSKYDDLDPIYLPDGHLMFSTTRANTFIRCAPELYSYVLARCDPDGKNIYAISRNNECDWLPALLPDGRVVYSRWEYSDKPLWRIQSLWTINPDGTGESVCWGNQSVWPDHLAMPRPIPGTHKIMFAGVGHHAWFNGSIGIIDTSAGGFNYPVGLTRVTLEAPWGEVGNGPQEQPHRADYHTAGKFVSFQTPWPLSEDLFLVSAKRDRCFDLYLMDVHGNRELIRRAQRNIFHAMPIRARSFPRLPDRVAWPGTGSNSTPARPGVLYSPDVYDGVPNLPRGIVKFLRVIQQDHKTYSTQRRDPTGAHGPAVSAVVVDSVKRILGTVPVREDGSVMFEVPAGRAVYFQLLDEHQRAVHTMRSFTGVMPGEIRGCTGCHEQQTTGPTRGSSTDAYRFKVSPVTPPPWGTNVTVGYERFVQPVLDKHCGKCHQGDGQGRTKLDLTLRPGIGLFKRPYLDLMCPNIVTGIGKFSGTDLAGINPVEHNPRAGYGVDPAKYVTVPPMTYLSYRSRLIDIAMSGKHHNVRIGGVELQQLIAWVDCNGPFLGEEEIRTIPDRGGRPGTIPFLTRTAPVIDRFNIPQDYIPQRDAPVEQGSEPAKGRP